MFKHKFWDRLGITLSGLCLVHCIALPLLLGVFPFFNNHFINEEFHLYFAILIIISALFAFIPGYQKHQDKKVVSIAFFGVTLLIIGVVIGHLGEHHDHQHSSLEEYAFSIPGSLLLTYAHNKNIQNCRCHD